MGNSPNAKELPGTEVEEDNKNPEVLFKVLNKSDMLYLCRDLEVRGVIVNAVSTDGSYLWINNSHIVRAEMDQNKLLEYPIFQPPFFAKGKRKILIEGLTSVDIDREIEKLQADGFTISARSPKTNFTTSKYIYLIDTPKQDE